MFLRTFLETEGDLASCAFVHWFCNVPSKRTQICWHRPQKMELTESPVPLGLYCCRGPQVPTCSWVAPSLQPVPTAQLCSLRRARAHSVPSHGGRRPPVPSRSGCLLQAGIGQGGVNCSRTAVGFIRFLPSISSETGR